MKIPKIIRKNNKEYIFEKEYPNFIMYKDMITGAKECFKPQELGMIKQVMRPTKDLFKIHKT